MRERAGLMAILGGYRTKKTEVDYDAPATTVGYYR